MTIYVSAQQSAQGELVSGTSGVGYKRLPPTTSQQAQSAKKKPQKPNTLYGNRAGSREFGLIQHGRTQLKSGQFALIILTFKQFSELYFMPAESD